MPAMVDQNSLLSPPHQAVMRHHYLGCALHFLLVTAGAVEIAGQFTDNAVLQRDKLAPIWGTGTRGEKVDVRFADQAMSTEVDGNGRWRVTLKEMPASKEGRTLEVIGSISGIATAKNILVGEVWLCSGQSNMELKVREILNAKDEVAAAAWPLIRHLGVPHEHAARPQPAMSGTWKVCAPDTVGSMTAFGYFFAREISRTVDVPVGLVEADWGGTRIEPWITPDGFRSAPELAALNKQVDAWDITTAEGNRAWNDYIGQVKQWLPAAEAAVAARQTAPEVPQAPFPENYVQAPTRLYNGMIHPLAPMALRGVLWYQGESNGSEGESYGSKFRALIHGWRKLFEQADLPFYWVQLANYRGPSDPDKPWIGDGWTGVREAQFKALAMPHTGMATIIDIGEINDIHPKNKQDVGKRLALWALSQDYGRSVVKSGPLYREHVIEGAAIRLRFDHVGSGLMIGEKKGLAPTVEVKGGRLAWFAIAGEDKVWRKAEARIDGDSVVVSAPDVAKPAAVRYAFAMSPLGCNLYNREGLPASPFRTDDWR